MSFKADELKVKIRSIVEKYLGLKLVVLFGSQVDGTESTLSDVDLLVEGEFSEAKLLMDLAEALNMPVERIDLLRVEHTPIKVLARALSHGVIILCREPKLLEKIVGEVALEYPEVIYSYRLNIEYSLDPEDRVDEIRLLDLLNNAVNRSKLLDRLLNEHSLEDFKKDEVLDSALRWLLYEIIQSMVDACTLLAASLKLGLAESYKDYIVALIKGGVMSDELGASLIELVSLRNRLAHRYRYIGIEELLHNVRRLVDEVLPTFRKWIYNTIKKYGRGGDHYKEEL
ncbi:MAG: DUF86 domain-containing protein [Thaumarchaeota archaeon]|jgi:uncharacterized protein YutE (UPF0331/DUF86 family)/predicted nucleotidyltransferase|nr:DUF86 domain-containing protein [Candidatus Geocrenenecus arthurdayi]MCL7391472.1 DUF86 domain-containing protein [Candidatus Geocrenenecus arthurdayi]MCL7403668.1 DUF86 domain-containing protein [Candidatus Geocrenenecus arthurdayi]